MPDLTMRSILRLTVLLIFILLLQACQHHQPNIRPLTPHQMIDLSTVNSYQFRGKMSFSDGKDGGTGSIQWRNNQGFIAARLKGPLGSKSWSISELEQGAELVRNDSTVYAASAEELVSRELGWKVPWEQLKSWVIGQAFNKKVSEVSWQEDGYTLIENGWSIKYSRLKAYPNVLSGKLPHKMIARKGDYSIKLSLKSWTW